MADDPLFFVMMLALVVVVVILAIGIGNFGKGGDPKTSNKLMRWRIIGQFIAVALILIFVLIRRGG